MLCNTFNPWLLRSFQHVSGFNHLLPPKTFQKNTASLKNTNESKWIFQKQRETCSKRSHPCSKRPIFKAMFTWPLRFRPVASLGHKRLTKRLAKRPKRCPATWTHRLISTMLWPKTCRSQNVSFLSQKLINIKAGELLRVETPLKSSTFGSLSASGKLAKPHCKTTPPGFCFSSWVLGIFGNYLMGSYKGSRFEICMVPNRALVLLNPRPEKLNPSNDTFYC